MATVWVEGLDRIHRRRGLLVAYDFSATPFVPMGRQAAEEQLFSWIVSDFGLNDAIESGLVKTPRVVIRDDGRLTPELRSRFYHLYVDETVREDVNRKAEPEAPLPDLLLHAYNHLGYDWRETAKAWKERGSPTPPVLISVVNNTFTAARVRHAFQKEKVLISELCDPERLLHID
jgi:type III restriction enzyme